jgi:hypothetical protein
VRKKTAACVTLVTLTLGAALALHFFWPAGPLRVGMTGEEVDSAMNQLVYSHMRNNGGGPENSRPKPGEEVWYDIKPVEPVNWLGDRECIVVVFDAEGRVVRWEKRATPNSRSWWDKVKFVASQTNK